ncbi:hypothetical protein V8F06_006137 [Rhypophila decipiens]
MTPTSRTILASYLPPLEGSEIRLVKISPRLRDGLIYCTVFCAELDEHPEFYALSYVWGDPEATVPILINNAKVNVTINLHRALSCFRAPEPGQEIDDPHPYNKACTAAKVWVWLGLDTDFGETPIDRFFKLAESLIYEYHERDQDQIGNSTKEQLDTSLSMEQHLLPLLKERNPNLAELLQPIEDQLHHPWFERRWTLQEAVLANGPENLLFDLGYMMISFDYLELLAAAYMDVEKSEPHDIPNPPESFPSLCSLAEIACLRRQHAEQMNHQPGTGSNSGANAVNRANSESAEYMHSILWRSIHRAATVPHDIIYGILGMVRNAFDLPDYLRPDYTADPMAVYQQFARFIMQNTGYLDMLHYRDNGVPSPGEWRCFDAQGIILDTISDKYELVCIPPLNRADEAILFSSWMLIFEKILWPAAKRRGVTAARILVQWINAMAGGSWTEAVNKAEFVNFCHRLAAESAKEGEDRTREAAEAITQQPFWRENQEFLRQVLPPASILTANANIIVLLRKPVGITALAPDDVISAIKGTSIRVVLRPTGLEGHYTVVGRCYVAAGVRAGRRHAFDEKYFEGKELKPIHIH